jgi:sterol desaturase/sphingolipid hydroxylase (fatty acid hydroxylase superfamily)
MELVDPTRRYVASSATAPWAVTWLTWPVMFATNLGVALYAIRSQLDYASTLTGLLAANVALLITLETLFPVDARWRMTRRSFLRDLKYFAASGVTLAATNALFGLASIRLNAGHTGPITSWPLYASAPIALVTVDFLNYWQHRWSHELRGRFGAFLWRIHAAHHLPSQVYVLMHVAGHPLNIFFVRGFVNVLPLYLLGASPETVLVANAIVTLQGLVSHCNLDLRAGWFNYLFVGTELHRYHHSADLSESKNYAATISLIDVIFGTFRHTPGRVPARLGVHDPAAYPDSNDFWRVMKLPFARDANALSDYRLKA